MGEIERIGGRKREGKRKRKEKEKRKGKDFLLPPRSTDPWNFRSHT